MIQLIGKSGTGIGKSGTGIGKSGTGIGKSGTGIGKSGTGSRSLWMVAAMVMGLTGGIAQPALAGDDPDVRVMRQGEVVMVSVQQAGEFLMGAAPLAGDANDYYAVELYPAGEMSTGFGPARTLVKGSGSGSSGDAACDPGASLMVKGSGSGSSGESACSSGASLMVKGSGSGNSGDAACDSGASLMVKGSGSGSSGESDCVSGASLLVKGSGSGSSGESSCPPGASLMVKGSGSGSSGESAGDCLQGAWGVAELLFDEGGASIILHRFGRGGLEEVLVAYLPRPGHEVETSSSEPGRSAFVAAP